MGAIGEENLLNLSSLFLRHRQCMRPTSLEKTLEYTFKNKELLHQAITHSSCFNEKKDTRHSDNEKLEYLGDAILNSIITILLYKKYKDKDEGFLSNARSCLVKRETLTEVAKTIDLSKHMSTVVATRTYSRIKSSFKHDGSSHRCDLP
jgi:dsRNA-specific ribonuclease